MVVGHTKGTDSLAVRPRNLNTEARINVSSCLTASYFSSGRADFMRARGGNIFLDMGGVHPNETFTIFIPADAATKFADFKIRKHDDQCHYQDRYTWRQASDYGQLA